MSLLRILSVAEARKGVLVRPDWEDAPLSESQAERSRQLFGEALGVEDSVRRILSDVRAHGDTALKEWTRKLDGVDLDAPGRFLKVPEAELEAALSRIPASLADSLRTGAERVLAFHKKQPALSWMDPGADGILGQKVCPIGRVGCYVPGGSAPLASTLIMTAMVARAAGVPEIVVISPPDRKTGCIADVTLAAARICGISEVYCAGGAQAIGALAFGTATIKRVDKIVGPGNTFVMVAKRQVFGVVGIDALPGPTETIVVADDTANPAWVAADMLAQSEHSGGTALLATPSRTLADKVATELERQTPLLASEAAIRESFASRSAAVITGTLEEAVLLADEWAPEHLCLSVADPWSWLGCINRAGGVFLGEHSYEVLGDYVAGPSHTMPTGGTARFTSPCNVLDFVRVMNVIALNGEASRRLGSVAATMADSEGLAAHAASARIRFI